MKQRNLIKIKKVVDQVFNDFNEDHNIILKNENELKKLTYNFMNKKIKRWKNSHKCLFVKCNKSSIKKSHVIPKEGCLRNISEKGHVFTPEFNVKENLIMKKVGINNASTFPGFCKEHENKFNIYEKKGLLNKPYHFKLQIYRTICREYFVKKFHLNDAVDSKEKYIDLRNERIKKLIKKKLGKNFLKNNEFKLTNTEFENSDYREEYLKNKIKELENEKDFFEEKYYKPMSKDIINKNESEIFRAIVLDVDIIIPVALAGRANIILKSKKKSCDFNIIINVLPSENKTYIVLATKEENEDELEIYLSKYNNNISIINMIETWMIYHSDHWFIKPSVWENIKEDKQNKILQDIFDVDKEVKVEYEYTIFNDLKRKIVNNYIEANKKDLVENELDKFTDQ